MKNGRLEESRWERAGIRTAVFLNIKSIFGVENRIFRRAMKK